MGARAAAAGDALLAWAQSPSTPNSAIPALVAAAAIWKDEAVVADDESFGFGVLLRRVAARYASTSPVPNASHALPAWVWDSATRYAPTLFARSAFDPGPTADSAFEVLLSAARLTPARGNNSIAAYATRVVLRVRQALALDAQHESRMEEQRERIPRENRAFDRSPRAPSVVWPLAVALAAQMALGYGHPAERPACDVDACRAAVDVITHCDQRQRTLAFVEATLNAKPVVVLFAVHRLCAQLVLRSPAVRALHAMVQPTWEAAALKALAMPCGHASACTCRACAEATAALLGTASAAPLASRYAHPTSLWDAMQSDLPRSGGGAHTVSTSDRRAIRVLLDYAFAFAHNGVCREVATPYRRAAHACRAVAAITLRTAQCVAEDVDAVDAWIVGAFETAATAHHPRRSAALPKTTKTAAVLMALIVGVREWLEVFSIPLSRATACNQIDALGERWRAREGTVSPEFAFLAAIPTNADTLWTCCAKPSETHAIGSALIRVPIDTHERTRRKKHPEAPVVPAIAARLEGVNEQVVVCAQTRAVMCQTCHTATKTARARAPRGPDGAPPAAVASHRATPPDVREVPMSLFGHLARVGGQWVTLCTGRRCGVVTAVCLRRSHAFAGGWLCMACDVAAVARVEAAAAAAAAAEAARERLEAKERDEENVREARRKRIEANAKVRAERRAALLAERQSEKKKKRLERVAQRLHARSLKMAELARVAAERYTRIKERLARRLHARSLKMAELAGVAAERWTRIKERQRNRRKK